MPLRSAFVPLPPVAEPEMRVALGGAHARVPHAHDARASAGSSRSLATTSSSAEAP